jgi:hypothetical protein
MRKKAKVLGIIYVHAKTNMNANNAFNPNMSNPVPHRTTA